MLQRRATRKCFDRALSHQMTTAQYIKCTVTEAIWLFCRPEAMAEVTAPAAQQHTCGGKSGGRGCCEYHVPLPHWQGHVCYVHNLHLQCKHCVRCINLDSIVYKTLQYMQSTIHIPFTKPLCSQNRTKSCPSLAICFLSLSHAHAWLCAISFSWCGKICNKCYTL